MSFSEHDFKQCLGSFATGVTVVSTTVDKTLYGVTINAFCSVSLTPPLVLFCLDKSAHCFPAYQKASHFCINVLNDKQKNLSLAFSGNQQEPWKYVDYTVEKSGCPIIQDNVAFLECEKWANYDGGDHAIFVGKVLALGHHGSNANNPLIYHKSQYHKINNAVE